MLPGLALRDHRGKTPCVPHLTAGAEPPFRPAPHLNPESPQKQKGHPLKQRTALLLNWFPRGHRTMLRIRRGISPYVPLWNSRETPVSRTLPIWFSSNPVNHINKKGHPFKQRTALFLLMAPRVGLEPTTLRLTAGCSTIELPGNFPGRKTAGS